MSAINPFHFNLLPCRRCLIVAAAALLAPGCESRENANRGVAKFRENPIHHGPELPLVDVAGVVQHPFEDPAAKATVLVFTMQDCPIANSYAPTLNQFFENYHARGIRFLLVHVDPQFADEAARKHADEYKIKAPVVVDRQHAWVKLAAATRSPQAVVFSPSGDVLYSGRIDDKYVGFGKRRTHVTAHDLKDALEAILAGRPVPKSSTEAIGCYIPSLPTGE